MTRTLRTRAPRAGLAVAALLTLAACGGIADDAPTDATTEDFCAAYADTELTGEDAAKKMADVGTPDGISGTQREGFEAYVEGVNDQGDDPYDPNDVKVLEDDVDKGNAFVDYAQTLCLEVEVPTDAPS